MRPRDRSLLALGSIALAGLASWGFGPRGGTWPEPVVPPVVHASEAASPPPDSEETALAAWFEPTDLERVPAPLPIPVADGHEGLQAKAIPAGTGTLVFVLVPRDRLVHDTAELVGRFVTLESGAGSSEGSRGTSHGRKPLLSSRIAADLSIEFRDLSTDYRYSLSDGSVDLAPFAPVRALALEVRRGETVRVELPLEEGLVLAGRVIDDDGVGVEGAHVHANSSYRAEVKTGTGGTFRFDGLTPHAIELTVDLDGYLHTVVERRNWGSSGVVEGIEILLSRGRALTGIVRLPAHLGGRPVVGAQIGIDSIREGRAPDLYSREAETSTNLQGRFRCSRLYGIRFSLTVTARIPPEALRAYGPVVQALGRREKAPLWTATIPDAALAPNEIVIVLAEAQSE